MVAPNNEKALASLLEHFESNSETVSPGNGDDFFRLCFGRIIALARGKIDVRHKGLPAYVQTWQYSQGCNEYDNAEFKILLGDKRRLQDGLFGFFIGEEVEETYKKLYADCNSDGSYIVNESFVSTSLSSEPIPLTLLLDPCGYISIRTGFLPEHKAELKSEFFKDALENIETLLSVAPIIAHSDSFALHIPGGMGSEEWSFFYVDSESQINTVEEIKEYNDFISAIPAETMEGYLKKRRNK